ncbi:MAG: AbrB/MazE/SpoVT family DNA-binding domain-containing protein [Nitrososphaerales archaeon]
MGRDSLADVLVETTKLSEKGQVVIPKDFRERMGLKPGSRFLVIAAEDAIILQRMEVVKRKIEVDGILNKARGITEGLASQEKG